MSGLAQLSVKFLRSQKAAKESWENKESFKAFHQKTIVSQFFLQTKEIPNNLSKDSNISFGDEKSLRFVRRPFVAQFDKNTNQSKKNT